MTWPIPVFSTIEYPKPISLRVWLPTLTALASGAVTSVLMLWPNGKPTNTLLFWCALAGAPLVACALAFGVKLRGWEDEQTDAEEAEKEQHRLAGMWREWTRRHLRVTGVAAFAAASNEPAGFADAKAAHPSNKDRALSFGWAKSRSVAFRRTRLLHLVARRFSNALRTQREVVITLMLDNASLEQVDIWIRQAKRIFGRMVPRAIFSVEARSATGGAQWIIQLADRIDTTTRVVIATQLWVDEEEERDFSEGGAAFLIEPAATEAGSIFRPMISARDTLERGLSQIVQTQMSPDRPAHVWSAGWDVDDATALRSVLKADPKDPVTEHLLDSLLGKPGPASGWIALAIAMEAMHGAGPQLVVWSEPESASLFLCTISAAPQKETTV